MDFEIDYANNLMNYINKRGKLSLQISVFSSIAYFVQYAKNTVVDILLIAEGMESELDSLQQYVKNIFLLSEGKYVREDGEIPSIYKFQSAEQVMTEIIDLYVDTNQAQTKLQLVPKTKGGVFIAVCSPQGGSSKTTFSMALAECYGKEKKVLYINFDIFSDLSWISFESRQQGLSELLYFIKQKNSNLSLKINTMVQKISSIYYLLPVRHYSDLMDIEKEDMVYLMNCIEMSADYEIVIMDIGYFHECMIEALDRCERIYMTLRDGFSSELRKKAFYKQLEEERGEEIINKIKEVELPYDPIVEKEPKELSQWVTGLIGTYILNLISNE